MKYYIIAGEASGDLHGANLMRAILCRDSKAEIRFWGGDRMAAVGGTMVRHIRDLAYMGLWEVATHLRAVLGNIAFCKKDVAAFQPDAMIFIDYPGFNLKIAAFTHQQGRKNFYYISPQIWAWKKGRIKKMRVLLDKLYYIQPFERQFYAANSFPQAEYVGHPLLDEVDNFRKAHPATDQTSTQRKVIALLPGSRRQEIKRSMSAFLHIAARHPEYDFRIAGMSLLGKECYARYLRRYALGNLTLVMDDTYGLLSQSYAALVCSGTATLETCLFNVPQVVCYRTSVVTAEVARQLLKIKYISLVNLIVDRPVVKELVQENFTHGKLEHEFHLLTQDDAYRASMLQGYSDVREVLGGGGASERTAQAILAELHHNMINTNKDI